MKKSLTAFGVLCLLAFAGFVQAQSPGTGKKSDEPRFTMEFKDARWRDVISWYVDQTELPGGFSSMPSGTFTYSSPKGKKLTLREVTDIINDGMHERGRVLLRRQNSVILWFTDERWPDYLVAKVRPNDLDEYDSHVPVEMRVVLKYLRANDIVPLVKKVLLAVGEVKVIPEANTLLIYDQVRILRMVAKLIEEKDIAPPIVRCEEPGRVVLFPRLHARLFWRR